MDGETLTGIILDDTQQLGLKEMTRICACNTEMVMELVAEGIITPVGKDPADWQFSGNTVIRVRTAVRLQRDLHVNVPGIALAIDLLDEINELQGRLGILE